MPLMRVGGGEVGEIPAWGAVLVVVVAATGSPNNEGSSAAATDDDTGWSFMITADFLIAGAGRSGLPMVGSFTREMRRSIRGLSMSTNCGTCKGGKYP